MPDGTADAAAAAFNRIASILHHNPYRARWWAALPDLDRRYLLATIGCNAKQTRALAAYDWPQFSYQQQRDLSNAAVRTAASINRLTAAL